jgi:hypothetical protein
MAEWQLVSADFVEAAKRLRESLPAHWHDDAVTDFDDAITATTPAELPYEIAEALVDESFKRPQNLRFAVNPWCVQQTWEAALRALTSTK